MPNEPMKIRPKYYAVKPKTEDGFKEAVAWFGGREFIASLKGTLMYMIYGENMDSRAWMNPNVFPEIKEEKVMEADPTLKNQVEKNIQTQFGELANLYSVQEDQIAIQMKTHNQVQMGLEKEVDKKWAKMIFDYWDWKRANFSTWEKYLEKQDFWKNLKDDKLKLTEFWFDFIADSGDGQMGVYNVACMCFSDLWLDEDGKTIRIKPPDLDAQDQKLPELLPRGYFLFLGGDTAYHTANYATLYERFQTPFRWAFASVRRYLFENYKINNPKELNYFRHGIETPIYEGNEPREEWDGTIKSNENNEKKETKGKVYWDTEPTHPLFGIPANHDYYDNVEGFNKQFRRSPFADTKENMIYDGKKGGFYLRIPSFSREQEASYVALRLPFDWWMFGIDSENERLDFRQEVFFKELIKDYKPSKLILVTPEPTTVFGRKCQEDDKTSSYLTSITEELGLKQPFIMDGKFEKLNDKVKPPATFCRLDLSGDVHHYARYWGKTSPDFDKGKDAITDPRFLAENYASVVAGGGGAFFDSTSTLVGNQKINGENVKGEIPPQKLYPTEGESIQLIAEKIFDLRNIRKGGYIQLGGAIGSIVMLFFLTKFSNLSQKFAAFDKEIMSEVLKQSIFSTAEKFITSIGSNFSWLMEKLYSRHFYLILTIFLLGFAALNLHNLIKEIKNLSFANNDEQFEKIHIYQLLKTLSPMFLAIVIYVGYLLSIDIFNVDRRFYQAQNLLGISGTESFEITRYSKSLFLLFHTLISICLLWLSAEYTNWLQVRFSVKRENQKANLLEKFENSDLNWLDEDLELGGKLNYFLNLIKRVKESPKFKPICESRFGKIVGFIVNLFKKSIRETSYEYFPATVLVILAVLALVFGGAVFGDEPMQLILADWIITILIVGSFLVFVLVLAYGFGAAYQTPFGKAKFVIIGVWHAILQITTPFILFYYTNWAGLLILFVVVLFFNGFSKVNHQFKRLFDNWAGKKWKVRLDRLFGSSLGAVILKQESKFWLTLTWVVYGLIILFSPKIFNYLFPDFQTLNAIITSRSPIYSLQLTNWLSFIGLTISAIWVHITPAFLVIGFIGYRTSRVWFSWYFAVSLLFDGHNNEIGGLARIQDYKHILRVKVEPDKLTVFVIGLDKAKPDINDMELRLVDKFEIKQKPI